MNNLIGTFFLILSMQCIYAASYVLEFQREEWYGFANFTILIFAMIFSFFIGLYFFSDEESLKTNKK